MRQMRGQFFALCSSRSLTPRSKKGLRGFRAIALLSAFSKWYTTVLVDLVHEEKEQAEWRRLHVGAREE